MCFILAFRAGRNLRLDVAPKFRAPQSLIVSSERFDPDTVIATPRP